MLRFVARYYFQERTFINQFLNATNKEVMHKELSTNLNQVQNLNTLIAFIDKSYKSHTIIAADLMQNIMRRATDLVQEDSNTEYLKGFLITLALNRIHDKRLYSALIQQIIGKHAQLSEEHLITIVETIVYNKLDSKYNIKPQQVRMLFEQLSLNQQQAEAELFNTALMQNIPKLINLIMYTNQQDHKLLYQIQGNVYALLFQLKQLPNVLSAEQLGFYLNMLYIMDCLEILFNKHKQIVEHKKQHNKMKEMFMDLVESNMQDKQMLTLEFNKEHIEVMLTYTKKYQHQPPLYLPKQIQNLIGNVYYSLLHEFNNHKQPMLKQLGDYNNFAYFLTKVNPTFDITDEDYKAISKLAANETNIYYLAKALEIISTNVQNHNERHHDHSGHTHPKLRDSTLVIIEDKISTLMKGHINPSDALTITFQSLVRLDDYHAKSFDQLLEYFNYGNVISRLKWVDLLIKFIPSLGLYTKKITKQFFLQVHQNNSQLQQLTDLWDKVLLILIRKSDDIQIDKVPMLLFYISQATKLDLKQPAQLLTKYKELILKPQQFTPQQLAELFYAYSKLNYKDNQLYSNFMSRLTKESLNVEQINLFLSGIAINKLCCQHSIDKITGPLIRFKMSDNVMLSYLQAQFTLQFEPNQEVLRMIKKHYYQSKNPEFIIGCATTLLIQDSNIDQGLLTSYMEFTQKNKLLFVQSPFYAHQLHLLYQKLTLQYQYPKAQLSGIRNVIDQSNISLAKYYIYFKKMKQSKLEVEIVNLVQKYDIAKEELEYYFIDDIIANPELISSIEQVIPYQIDYRVGKHCFEVNGPHHYVSVLPEGRRLDGATMKKKELLESIGFKYIEVDHLRYSNEGEQYIKQLLS